MSDSQFPEPDTTTPNTRRNPIVLVLGGITGLVLIMVVLHLTGVVG